MWKPLGNSHHPHSYEKIKTTAGSDKHTQQKRHPLMLLLKKYTLQKWHVTNTPLVLKQTNMAVQKKDALQNAHFAKKMWSWNFKIEFFPL